MKKIYSLILLCVLFTHLPSSALFADNRISEKPEDLPEGNYGRLIEKVFAQSPAYKSILSEYEQGKLARTAYKFRWIPHPFIDSGYTGTFYTGTDKDQANAIQNGFSFSQALPAGITLQAKAEQFFGIKRKSAGGNADGLNYEYDFGASAGLSFPLYAASPSLLSAAIKSELHTHRLLSDAAAIDLRSARKRILSETVNRISSYLLLKERIGIEEKLEILRQKESLTDNALWEKGALSSFELSERTTKRYEQYLSLLRMKENLFGLEGGFYNLGLAQKDIPASIDLWIAYWENFIRTDKTENGLEFAAQEKRLTFDFYNKAEQGLSSLPKINISANAAPVAGTSKESGVFIASVKDYWKSAEKWQWSLTAGIRISLFPFDRAYLTSKEFSLVRDEYNNAQSALAVYRQNKEKAYKNGIALLQKLSEKAEKEKTDAYNKVRTASVLQIQGYLSETSFAYQKLNALLAENACKEIRLRYISAVLEGY